MKILHILYQSFPNISGSSTRSRDLINSQFKIGLKPVVVSSPFQNGLEKDTSFEYIDDIKYYRTFSNSKELVSESQKSLYLQIVKILRIIPFTYKLWRIAKVEKPDIIHAHAMFFCAISGKIVAYLVNAKFVYEVRSLWEERGDRSGLGKNLIQILEKFSLKLSSQFIVINSKLKLEFVARGYHSNLIHVVPNAINLDRILCDDKISFQSKKTQDLVFSYIGSVSPIEGLDNAIQIFHKLRINHGIKNKFCIYGDGIELNRLKELVTSLNMIDQVLFLGKFTSKDIPLVYSKVDVVITPRIKSKITDSVTPLKPLEALAYFKLFIGSDVGGISELISDRSNGILYNSESIDDLYSKLLWVLDDNNKDECLKLIRDGEQFVRENRSWRVNANKYIHIYKDL